MSSDWDRPMTVVDEQIERHPWLAYVILLAIILLMGLVGAME